ncbi:MAG: hypothetical protein P9L94_11690 [Candidatus Hinthialibacter antarcticus]|nr:hypothetical protein [Candidatus Hinthialibacter antarcticus]
MSFIDYTIIALYLIVVVWLGFWYQKKASQNLRAYFLGGNKIHWLALAMSGSVSTFDITGTMWIVSLLYVMGMKSMWVHWMWGVMLGAFCFSFMGKWVRRSNVMTGAEWMSTRFGDGSGGRSARLAYAFMAIVTQATFIGYAYQGIGKFSTVYLALPPLICAVAVIGVTTLYVLMGGFFGVVITDVIQTVILTVAGVIIAVIAYQHVSPDALNSALPTGWDSIQPMWEISSFAGTENAAYQWFGLLVIAWVMKGFLLNAGGPSQLYDFQRFLSARDERSAALIGASWSFFLMVRWAMAMGIVLLALSSVSEPGDPEKIMPTVLRDFLPVGFRGLVIAGLLAAFMSTFSSTVNSAASYIVRDFWQPFIQPDADDQTLIRASYVSTIGVVAVGVLIGMQANSIAGIFNWLMMALSAAVVAPNVLRWYWWRFNGWGYAAGTLTGFVFSILPLLDSTMPIYIFFPVIIFCSSLVAIMVSLFTAPIEQEVLNRFYKTVKPFGLWGPVSRQCPEEKLVSLSDPYESPYYAILNTFLGIIAIGSFYLFPMYLVGHWHTRAIIYFGLGLTAITVLYFTWYRHLPKAQA